MNKETTRDDPHRDTDASSMSQTDEPWKGNPEKEQRSSAKKADLEKWHETNTH